MTIPRDQGFRGIFILRPSYFNCVHTLLCLPFSMNLFPWPLIVVASVSITAISCAEHNIPLAVECLSNEEISYMADVEPIIETVCAVSGCHNGSNGADRNWLVFSNLQNHASEVRRRITLPSDHPDHMPRAGSLSSTEIQTIICWVDQGAQNN